MPRVVHNPAGYRTPTLAGIISELRRGWPAATKGTTMTTPEDPAFGYGELVRAKRLYMGLSQREMARKIPMDRRTYQRIETDTEQCPVGFIDTMNRIKAEFDTAVIDAIGAAEDVLGSRRVAAGGECVRFTVKNDEDGAWTRAVIGRASVVSPLIRPILYGSRPVKEAVPT